jgi:uncharacterized protein YndB with AHSA1/START domain
MANDRQREYRDLAGLVGSLQQRVAAIEERIRELETPDEDVREPNGNGEVPVGGGREGVMRLRPHGGYQVQFERHFDQPIEEVWRTITEPNRLSDWLADADVDFQEGGKIELRFANSGSVTQGIVTEVEPPNVFEYFWITAQSNNASQPIPTDLAAGNGTCGDNTLAGSRIRFELARSQGGNTVLTLTHTVPLNPDLIPNPVMRAAWAGPARRAEEEKPKPDMVLAAWETHLDLLEGALRNPGNRTMSRAGRRSGDWPWDGFEERRNRYAQTIR